MTEVYDGQTFPEYYYESTLASAEVGYNDRTELILLPGEELAIKRRLQDLVLRLTKIVKSNSRSKTEMVTHGRNVSKESFAVKDCMRQTRCFTRWIPAIWIGIS